jgi:ABC-type uncharacterized transport system involved in gliding motility auxiliary subunit
VVIVMVNLVGLTVFFRMDLTGSKIFSLSDVSKQVVSTLKEPLTVKVFFTKNLPAPHNNTERYLHDLLEEYALNANQFFSFEFYDVSPESETGNPAGEVNRQLAETYGINPVQIQQLEKDEVKFQRAYMGLVLIHGDMVEKIPTITTTEGLEYNLTSAMMKVNNKISALLNLKENVRIQLILSSSLMPVAPFMNVPDLPAVPQKLEEIVKKLNIKNYGRLEYARIDPTDAADQNALAKQYNIPVLQWPDMGEGKVAAGKGVIGLVMTHQEKSVTIPIFQVLRLPLIGNQYQLASLEEMEEMIDKNVETLVNINEEIGYLSDHGALPLGSPMPMGPQPPDALNAFSNVLTKNYSVHQVALKNKEIPRNVKCIVIARPTEAFTDWELYEIDQALMRGQNLAIFLEPFKEIKTQVPNAMGFGMSQRVTYEPLSTGLEKLLAHYGVGVRDAIVLDENCFIQQLSNEMGGGQQPIYFAPVIQNKNINKDFDFMQNIKGILAVKASPVELIEKRLSEGGIKATQIISSSEKSWEMKAPINLEPQYIAKPGADTHMDKKPLAYLLSGEFASYFADKPVPEKKTAADLDKEKNEEDLSATDEKKSDSEAAKIVGTAAKLTKGKPAKIFIAGSAELVRDDIIDPEGRGANAVFIMNMLDLLNDREGIAVMRSKTQGLNPLEETGAETKMSIKAFNIVGLPVLVALMGLLVWGVRHSRKKSIQAMFSRS